MPDDAKPPVGARFPDRLLWTVEIVDECDSTNRVLADRARQGATDPVLLVARHQTAGKGRLGRSWEAPAGSAFMGSWLVPVNGSWWQQQPWLLSMAVGLCVVDLAGQVGIGDGVVSLKWPNDVMALGRQGSDPKKLCGILAEYVSTTNGGVVVVGVGVNAVRPHHVEGVLAERGVWLSELGREVGGVSVEVDALIEPLHQLVMARVRETPSVGALLSEYRQKCSTIGQMVRVEQVSTSFVGLAVDVDEDAALIVQEATGTRRKVTVADVVHLKIDTEETL